MLPRPLNPQYQTSATSTSQSVPEALVVIGQFSTLAVIRERCQVLGEKVEFSGLMFIFPK